MNTTFKLCKNILLGILITILLIAIDQFFKLNHHQILGYFNYPQLGIVLVIGLLLPFLKHTKIAFLIYSMMIFFLFVQLVHYSYFGVRIYPIEISLFFTHSSETLANFGDLIKIALLPFFICIGALTLALLGFFLCKNRLRCRFAWILLMVIFLIPLVDILHPMLKNKVGKDPHISLGDRPNANDDLWYSTQKLLVFYFVYTLPRELLNITPKAQPIERTLKQASHPDINIIFIQGESLTWKHMSAFGYHRLTTPYLDALKNDPNVVLKKGISSGVSTDVSLPEFFNMVWKPDGTQEIVSLHRNLFRMARKNGFDTHFISTQFDQWFGLITEYLYPAYINHFQILGKSILYVPDEQLVDYIANTDLTKKNFLVVQMGGSHAPYYLRYPEQFDIYKSDTHDSFHQNQTNTYDNSVLHTDFIIKSIIDTVKAKTNKPTYIIFTSDHGESLGNRGIYGHNNIHILQEHQVPILIVALHGANLDFMKTYDQQSINSKYMSHYDLSNIISYMMGYRITRLSTQRRGYYVTGAILNGFAGYIHITFNHFGKMHDHRHRGG